MDVAEMKIANRAKGSAKPDANKAQGEALATVVVAWAWKEVEAEEKRGSKMALFVQDICNLSPEGHKAFRDQLSAEMASIRELEKVSGLNESRKAGYSLNSFTVMVSNWRAISEAAQIGFKGKEKDGAPMQWTKALETAREYRKAHVSAGGTQKTAAGKALGAGRKPLTDFDKAIRAAEKLTLRDMRKLQAFVNSKIEAMETTTKAKQVH